jgi:hypothetical protein
MQVNASQAIRLLKVKNASQCKSGYPSFTSHLSQVSSHVLTDPLTMQGMKKDNPSWLVVEGGTWTQPKNECA